MTFDALYLSVFFQPNIWIGDEQDAEEENSPHSLSCWWSHLVPNRTNARDKNPCHCTPIRLFITIERYESILLIICLYVSTSILFLRQPDIPHGRREIVLPLLTASCKASVTQVVLFVSNREKCTHCFIAHFSDHYWTFFFLPWRTISHRTTSSLVLQMASRKQSMGIVDARSMNRVVQSHSIDLQTSLRTMRQINWSDAARQMTQNINKSEDHRVKYKGGTLFV